MEARALNFSFPLASHGEGLLAFLEARRSVPATGLGEPGPDGTQLRRILTLAARVPDHGALEPWRFIVVSGDARKLASEELSRHYAAENDAMNTATREKFTKIIARLFTHAPVVVIVVSRSDPAAQIPAWEQELSAGALCMNLVTAAHVLGFATSWVTGWAAYSPGARMVLKLAETERIAGIIHIGTATEKPTDRKRPDIDAITAFWQPAQEE
jgi:nitroreductase